MKINNDDVKKITEIKQWLIDPPVSFKLRDYAVIHVKDAISVLNKYPLACETVAYFNTLQQQLENKIIKKENLNGELKNAGTQISRLTSK